MLMNENKLWRCRQVAALLGGLAFFLALPARKGREPRKQTFGAIEGRGLRRASANSGWLGLGKERHCTTELCALVSLCMLAGCSGVDKIGIVDPRYGASSSARLYGLGEPIPKGGGVGLYRLTVKWGWFEGDDPKQTRERLKRLKWGLTVFFLALGLLTLAAYMKIGYEHSARVGERYTPVHSLDQWQWPD